MKTKTLLLLIVLATSIIELQADIIPGDSHYVSKCVKITNLNKYQDISFLGRAGIEQTTYGVYEITSADCLEGEYWYFEFYAINKLLIDGINIEEYELYNNNNAVVSDIKIDPEGSYYHDSIPYESIELLYRVMGFTELNVILHEWKQTISFNNGQPDSVYYYEYKGDSSILSQEIILGVENKINNSVLSVFPNPTKDKLNVKINTNTVSEINANLYSTNGKLIESQLFFDNEFILPLDDVEQGVYLLQVKFDDTIETRKVLIK